MLAADSLLDCTQHSGQTPPSKSLQDTTASSAETDWASQIINFAVNLLERIDAAHDFFHKVCFSD
jgi:hypothetical protein